jgi:sarcosine oxidase subunit beta
VVTDGTTAGIDMTFIPDADGVREIAPVITGEVHAASFCPTDGHANPTATVQAFAAAATRAGATIVTGVEVTGILASGDRVTGVSTASGETHVAGTVIVAAGVYTPQLLAPLGLHLPIQITHVPVVQTVPVPRELDQVIGIATGHFAGRQEVSGRYRLTVGNTPWQGTRHTADSVMPTLAQIEDTVASSIRVLPGLADIRIGRVWGGLIDRTPDVLPVIERSSQVEGLVMAAGFSGHGFCLGPVTGEILADLALEGTTAHLIAPFALDRFAGVAAAESLQLHG